MLIALAADSVAVLAAPMIFGGPRTVVAPDLLLLDSKLSVPPPRPGTRRFHHAQNV